MSWIMLWLVVLIMKGVVATEDPAAEQLVTFLEKTPEPVGVLSTSGGVKIDNSTASTSLNKNLFHHKYFMDLMTHFVRERLPERMAHARGAGAFGYFEVTNDLSDICKAKIFSEVGKNTSVAVRFSLVSEERGEMDTSRDARGFAVKFYTEEGNLDIVGLNTPTFPVKDPIFFPALLHVLRRNPETHLKDPNMLWDFVTLHPEAFYVFINTVFSDRGVPYGYQYMPGYGIHTFQVVNENGDINFVRFHFNPEAGIKNMRSEDAISLGGSEPDYAIKFLYNDIANGTYPSWSVGVQVLSQDDVANAGFDVFDITKELPLDKYPLREFGRLVLNKNPSNYFAEVEQMAFCPGNLVPGILGGPDKLFESRVFAYRDAQNHRLGVNFNKIQVNKPITTPYTYNRDGVAPVGENESNAPNYYPNTFSGPQPYIETNGVDLISIHEDLPNNFNETSQLYINEFTDEQRTRLIENIVASLGLATEELQKRALDLFTIINADLGTSVQEALQANNSTDEEIVPLV